MGNESIDKSERFLRMIRERLGADILFECFAGLIARPGKLDARDIHVIPRESHRRNYKNDIVPAPREYSSEPERYCKENGLGGMAMYTSRSSILDYLPEDFYTEPDNTSELWNEKGEKRTPAEVEKYRERVREQQKSAERFFRPLEVEYNRARIERELKEVRRLENFDRVLEAFWGNYPITNARWRRFVRTLHLAPCVIGDLEKAKALIEFVLATPVSLSLSVEECCEVTDVQQQALMGNEKALGFNMAVGGTVYDYLETCILKIENLSTSEFFEYFKEKSEDRKLLEEIIKYYFPLNVEVRLDFSINPKKRSAGKENSVVVLGYSSTLGG